MPFPNRQIASSSSYPPFAPSSEWLSESSGVGLPSIRDGTRGIPVPTIDCPGAPTL